MRAAALLPLLTALGLCADPVKDQVTNLPGVTFEVKFKHYSGYLDGTAGNHLHYWFFESQANPTNDPLIVWLNGQPFTQTVSGPLKENGPFHPTKDGQHLQENVFAWNKIVNVLFIDSPVCTGFSYRDQGSAGIRNRSLATDDLVAALQGFIVAYPQFKNRDLYVAGEWYGGIFVPRLVNALLQESDLVQLKLKGFAIGNGLMRFSDSFNANIDLLYYRGQIGKQAYDSLIDCCTASGQPSNLLYCDFSYFVDISNGSVISAKTFTDATLNACAVKVNKFGNAMVFKSSNSPFNPYQDCYTRTANVKSNPALVTSNSKSYENNEGPFFDQGANQFADSTDAMGGFQCYVDDAMDKYLNLPDVRKALHVEQFTACGAGNDFVETEWDMTAEFAAIIDSGADIRGLIYNGDMDLTSSFLADQWFLEEIAAVKQLKVVAERAEWTYKRGKGFPPVGGGYSKRFGQGKVALDLVQVKGAGLFTSTDRPAPTLQMIRNFIESAKSYDHTQTYTSIDAAPLLKEFLDAPAPELSRKEEDRVFDLPGLTWKLNFDQYAGYLNGIKGNYLHYWFVESQRDPKNDPLVLWLSGGPGCSGYTALLWGNGPFRPNRDQTTLYENIYSWNKIANVIFIDSPRGVGYSFQNFTENPSLEWNDELTAEDLKLALLDFLGVYPEYKNRHFYLTGESYGGVYVPSTAVKLIELIQAGTLPYLNFQGIAVGNGVLSNYDSFNSRLQYQYFHGALGKEDWDSLQQCCKKSDHPGNPAYFESCDFARAYFDFDEEGSMVPKDPDSFCAQRTINITSSVWSSKQTAYNLYTSCYDPLHFDNRRPELVEPFYKKGFVDQARLISRESTDSQDGLFCWGMLALRTYMNTPEVQSALHVRQDDKRVVWTGCSQPVGNAYKSQYFDMRPFFRKMIDWGKPFKLLIYAGDVDSTCNFLSGQWFADDLAKEYDMKLSNKHASWKYEKRIGGYALQYAYKDITIDVVTVKGAGHFTALDRPGPTLQVISSLIDGEPLDTAVNAKLELTDLLERYAVEEQVGREKDLTNTPTRVKRAAARVKLPPPPPQCNKANDKIVDLPGLTFELGVNQYSGYVSAGTGDYLHYWLIEADTDEDNAPLILWFNGGPGCSSLTGLLSELGPFLNNPDLETLYENVYSWHKVGNMLFLESPRGVGFSYQASDSDPTTIHDYNDALTAEGSVAALVDFIKCYPEYKNRKVFITGESYNGVYIPTFVDLLLKKIRSGDVKDVNLEGLAIGNGEFSDIKDINTALTLSYMKGFHSKAEYESMGKCVPDDFDGPMSTFDFTQYIHFDSLGLPIPNKLDENTLEGFCGRELFKQAWLDVWLTRNDVYNTNQDCYQPSTKARRVQERMRATMQKKVSERDSEETGGRVKRDTIGRPMVYSPFIDEAKRVNYDSTDASHGAYCYSMEARRSYLNITEVREALHIPEYLPEWEECSPTVELRYDEGYNDTTPVFESIFESIKQSGKPLRFLIYHGDADMACQFLGGQWFIEELAQRNAMEMTTPFTSWDYQQTKYPAVSSIGGYQKSWAHMDGLITLDLVTVKGAGHMVQLDRPGPALQMFHNFVLKSKDLPVKNPVDYNFPLYQQYENLDRKPLKPEYLAQPTTITTRANADKIYDLPGLTYNLGFDQWSGYLQGGLGTKLFYWFFQSQNTDPATPVVLWLNGGPGCSSLIGLFTENGPFRVNPDQRTLWENVYSWNKAAHILYIDSPRIVGFSYQNMTENPAHTVSDDDIAPDAYLALEDFFTIFPAMKTKEFYTSGESYCGVYLPLITTYLAQKIEAGVSTINLKGMIIGNGQVSFKQDLRTSPSFSYMKGIIDKTQYDTLADCCTGDDAKGGLYCHYDDFFQSAITLKPKTDLDAQGKKCVAALEKIDLSENSVKWQVTNDAYNLYQDCYAVEGGQFAVSKSKSSYKSRILSMRHSNRIREAASHKTHFGEESETIDWGILDPISTDNTGGYQCWMDDATTAYLTMDHVRTALHVPAQVSKWEECVNLVYTRNKEDMSEQFEHLMNSPLDLRVLLYNGDIDDVCQLQQAQWFVETLASKNGWTQSDKSEWHYRGVIAGYQTSYKTNKKFSLDLLTVKGAGHMVPTDRPGPALQMIDAFLKKKTYDTPVPYSTDRKPLLPQFTRQAVLPGPPTTVKPDDHSTSSPTTTTATTTTTTTQKPDDPKSTSDSPTTFPTTTSTTSTTTSAPTTSIAVGFTSFIFAIFSIVLMH